MSLLADGNLQLWWERYDKITTRLGGGGGFIKGPAWHYKIQEYYFFIVINVYQQDIDITHLIMLILNIQD